MRKAMIAVMAAGLATGCASTADLEPDEVYDPFEGFNRGVFAFNEAADQVVVGPVANVYETVTPGFVRTGIGNVLSNLNSPVVFVNDVLQGESTRAGDTFYRFFVNTTIGVLGVWDAAAYLGVEGHTEDFGQTLAVWGVEEGPFLVLPLLGPSNLRDFSGRFADNAFDPLNWVEFESDEDLDDTILITRNVLGVLNTRVALDGQLRALREQPEPYIAMRRAYTSQRQAAVRNGQEEQDPYKDLPDFDAFDDFEEEPALAGE